VERAERAGFCWSRFRQLPVLGILRGYEQSIVEQAVAAAARGGLRNVEVTWDTPGAAEQIRSLRQRHGASMNVGVGTVRGMADLEAALEAGAGFVVTPTVLPAVITACRERGVPVFPGALTPSEVQRAWDLGADLVKLFPASAFGVSYVRALKAPLGDVKLMPTGGVGLRNLREYLLAGADALALAGGLFARQRLLEGDWAWVQEQAGALTACHRAARAARV